jgi:hypothetical protein
VIRKPGVHICNARFPVQRGFCEQQDCVVPESANHGGFRRFPHGRRYYTKSGYFSYLDDSSIDRLVEAVATIPSSETQIELAYLGGAAARIGADETAFGDRSAPFIMNLLANWSEPSADAGNIPGFADSSTSFGRP